MLLYIPQSKSHPPPKKKIHFSKHPSSTPPKIKKLKSPFSPGHACCDLKFFQPNILGSSISSTATVSSTATAARDFALRFAAPVPVGSLHGASTAEVEVARKSRQEATAAGASGWNLWNRDDGGGWTMRVLCVFFGRECFWGLGGGGWKRWRF